MSGRLLLGMLGVCAVLAGGCAQLPRIDPTGEHLFIFPSTSSPPASPGAPVAPPPVAPVVSTPVPPAENPSQQVPGPQTASDDVALLLAPAESVQQIGTEVILVAGVGGPDGYLRTNRRLEWLIAPGSVGHFVAVGQVGFLDVLLGDYNSHKKIDGTYAVGSTSRQDLRLTRGTPNPADDVPVRSGEGWVSVSSPLEGTTQVDVLAPSVYGWDQRMKTARIHWVDANWTFPSPAINPAGTKHVFTTSVFRQSNQAPCPGWIVRYSILGGPPAGFAPDGAETVELRTNEAGQAGAEIFQKAPGAGTNPIRIEVIRPGDLPGADGRKLVLGSGTTMATWTAAGLAIKVLGPAVGTVGSTLTYRIEVTNPGDLPAGDVQVSNPVPEGLSYLDSNPPAQIAGNVVLWRLGELGAGQTQFVEVHFRAEREGEIVNSADATAGGGMKVSQSAVTAVTPAAAGPAAPSVGLQVDGPPQASVGDHVTFEITVTNHGPAALTGLKIFDRADPGLYVRPDRNVPFFLDDLAAGQAKTARLVFQVVQAGRHSHTVQVTDAEGRVLAQSTKTLTAVGREASGPTPTAEPGASPTPVGPEPAPGPLPPAAPPGKTLEVQKTGPTQSTSGEIAAFSIILLNHGDRALTNLKVVDEYPPELQPANATQGHNWDQGKLTWILPDLPAGKGIELQIQCRCMAPSPRAVNRVRVVTAEGVEAEASATVEIVSPSPAAPEQFPAIPSPDETTPPETAPPPETPAAETPPPVEETPPPAVAKLSLSIVGKTNPVNRGRELEYVIEAANDGTKAAREVGVQITLPPEMLFVPLGTTGPNKPQREGRTIRFAPLAEIPPGEKALYHLRAYPKASGTFKVVAEMSSPDLAQPLAADESTTVN
ncbi:MAG: DUF11 domain-containing protein [Pirellulales bacterium]|nr:DUF11 domain-containing protein [Pirellulales bacterium]